MGSPRVHLAKTDGGNRSVCRHTSRPSRSRLLLANWAEFIHPASCMRPRCSECVAYANKLIAADKENERIDAAALAKSDVAGECRVHALLDPRGPCTCSAQQRSSKP